MFAFKLLGVGALAPVSEAPVNNDTPSSEPPEPFSHGGLSSHPDIKSKESYQQQQQQQQKQERNDMSQGTKPETPNLGPKTVFYLGILRVVTGQSAEELVADRDLNSYSRWTRNNYEEFVTFTAKTVAERTPVNERSKIVEKICDVHVYQTGFGFCAILMTEPGYDPLTAQQVLTKTVNEFRLKFTPEETKTKKAPFSWPEVKKLRADAVTAELTGIAAVNKELDATKIVLHQTIQAVLERGEKLDTLVAKSDELSGMSKGFYKTAKQQNSCCVVM